MAVLKKAEDEHRLRYQEGLKEQREFLQRQSEAGPARTVESPAESIKPVEVPSDAAKAAGAVPAATPTTRSIQRGRQGRGSEEGRRGRRRGPSRASRTGYRQTGCRQSVWDTGAARA